MNETQLTWNAWTFRIGNKAFKGIRPISMEIVPERAITSTSGMLWWKKDVEELTGNWVIKLKHDRGPATIARIERIVFERENEAQFWFDQTYSSVFVNKIPVMEPHKVPKPPVSKKKPKKPKPHLRLL